jgi:hypothetical protein
MRLPLPALKAVITSYPKYLGSILETAMAILIFFVFFADFKSAFVPFNQPYRIPSASVLQVAHHLFELFFCDLSLGIPLFEYRFRIVLVSVVISSSPRPDQPFCYPEDYEYQEDPAQQTERERKEGSLRPRT